MAVVVLFGEGLICAFSEQTLPSFKYTRDAVLCAGGRYIFPLRNAYLMGRFGSVVVLLVARFELCCGTTNFEYLTVWTVCVYFALRFE